MTEPELALAMSVREWPDRLHRFLVDYGGARVRLTAMRPEDLTSESFDVLLIDDICSFLTPGLVVAVARRGRGVVGVYDPDESPDGKDRLVECGVSDVIESDADPEEFLSVVNRVAASRPRAATPEVTSRAVPTSGGKLIVVTGPSGGVGITEAAVAVAHHLARRVDTTLVDADPLMPSVAQRLALELHPNLWTAVDLVEQGTADPRAALQNHGPLHVLTGLPPAADDGLRIHQLQAVLDLLASWCRFVVLDVGWRQGRWEASLLEGADVVVVVGLATPIGLTRLAELVGRMGRRVHLLINRAPRDRYRRGEIVEELTAAYRPAGLVFLPEDPSLGRAGWDGKAPAGSFMKAVGRWVDTYLGRP